MYTVLRDGDQFGPYSKEQIASMLQSGDIDASAMVWCEGWPNWLPVGNLIPPQVQQPTFSPSAAPVSRTIRNHSSAQKTWVIAGAIGVVIIVAVAAFVFSGPPDPNFSVRPAPSNVSTAWLVINKDSDALTVYKFVINGEKVANLGSPMPGCIFDSKNATETTIGIGQSQSYYQSSNAEGYRHEAVFIDVYTNRGNFRYRPAQGFTSETPVYDEIKVQQAKTEIDKEDQELKQKFQQVNNNYQNQHF